MQNYILNLIISNNPNIPMSWGINSFRPIENGLTFKVQGFKFKGDVEIVYDEIDDLFNVKYIKGNNVSNETNGIYADELQSVLDDFIEKTENYEEDVENYLNSF